MKTSSATAFSIVSKKTLPKSAVLCQNQCSRLFTNTPSCASGHSKWSTIKHDKQRTDAAKNRKRTTMSHNIASASKQHGPDPKCNVQLATAIANAKRTGMHKETIEAAIMRGQGRSVNGAILEDLIIEAMLPPIALIIDCQTDNKGKALSDLRTLLKSHGAAGASTAFLFDRRGRITFAAREGEDVEELLEAALETEALDVNSPEPRQIVVDTEPQALKSVEAQIWRKTGLETDSLETMWVAKPDTAVQDIHSTILDELQNLIKSLEEYPGVQTVYTNCV